MPNNSPLLSYSELSKTFKGYGIDISGLKKPTPNYVKEVYTKFIELILSIQIDEFAQIKFTEKQIFEHQELHDVSVFELEFFRNL
jgi:hypothetical protein